jgi:two-component system, OmpR family, response regulator QseB
MNRILIVEDEPRIAAFLEKGLQANGYTTTVINNGNDVSRTAIGDGFDLMILDLGLPGKSGLAVLEEVRGQGSQIPVIILTARDSIDDKVTGFDQGADDYLTKPFHFSELLVRVRARLRDRESALGSSSTELQLGEIVLNLITRQVKVGNQPVELSIREFTLAEMFLRHPGQVLTRQQLLDQVWGYDYDPGSNIVDVYVGYLRKKFGNDRIETVRGVGYRLRSKAR